jgi:phosphatidylserine/phosphatidylglycerophosphate/cardiolipin synthase-like enzyme
MLAFVISLPPHARARLIDALESEQMLYPPTEMALRSVLGSVDELERCHQDLCAWSARGGTAAEVAGLLRGVSKASGERTQTDLVWSGPRVQGVHARNTRHVYEELLGSARKTLWVSSYVFFDGQKAFEAIARRMDECPGLRVAMLLNIQRPSGDTTIADELVRRFAEGLWRREWPGARRPDVYYSAGALNMGRPDGTLHAKAVVANLTEAALDRNIELGLLLRDRALALAIVAQFQGLIDAGKLLLLPRE